MQFSSGSSFALDPLNQASQKSWKGVYPRTQKAIRVECFLIVAVDTEEDRYLTVGIIIGASAAIGYTVVNSATTVSLFSAADGSDSGSDSNNGQQHLLEMAERVITACDENRLNEDISECQKLCYSRMCCFEKDEYGCQADAGKDCAVYAGCEALVQGVLDEE